MKKSWLICGNFWFQAQGHPERQLPGIETTSGPLGCGLSQAVGMAYHCNIWVAILSDLFTAVWVMASLMKVIFGKWRCLPRNTMKWHEKRTKTKVAPSCHGMAVC